MSEQDQADFIDSLARQVGVLTQRIATLERGSLEDLLGVGLPGRIGSIGSMPTPPAVGGGPVTPASVLQPGAVGAGVIGPGAIADLTSFANTIRPVAIVTSLPTLPDARYPEFSYVVLTTDERLYKNIADVWVKGVNGADIEADTITAGQIAAGAISASEIAAGAITTEKLGLVDVGGSTLLNGAGFQGAWRKFIESTVYNSDFAAPPPTPASNVDNSTNPLPYWTLTKVSGTAINAKSVADSGAGSGRALELTMLAGAAGDDTYIEQIIPISGNRSLISALRTFISFRCTSDSVAVLYGLVHMLDSSLSVIGGGATHTATCTEVNAEVDDTRTFSISTGGITPTPANAAFLRVRAGLKRDAAATGSTVTAFVTGVHVERYIGDIILPDTTDATVIGGRIFQDDSVTWLTSRFGDAESAHVTLNGEIGDVRITTGETGRLLHKRGDLTMPIDPVGLQPAAMPLYFAANMAVSSAANLAAAGGSRAIPIVVTAPMKVKGYHLWSTDTASARSCEIRLYRDIGAAALEFITGSNATMSFTPGAASVRSGNLAGVIDIAPGIYWLVLRNTHGSNTFGIGTTATASSLAPTANLSQTGVGALGSTIDITGWTESSAIFGIMVYGAPFDNSTDWGVVP